ncbi:hypothetical protein D9Q98_010611 [Chlorella vulgaris]|uniref:Uncharacterized protein n=1 Tax=Chlorella vulgaris TaxID=3077 RepID=A0A9D4TRV9_CHLVU|nr:hypothetical protein D9Q98_010611 [Chlorella vulgaris]
MYTQFGEIRVQLLEKLAPRITSMVWELAAHRNCTTSHSCAFYRNEARPLSGEGPPYALLQGRMYDLPQDPPFEGNIEVWGLVDDWQTPDIIVSQQYTNWSHNGGTVLRILKIEVPWTLAVEGDRTFGPL